MSSPVSRQQRRAAEKAARDYYDKRGLPPGGSTMPLVIHTRSLIRILAQKNNDARASEAAAASFHSFDRSAKHHPPEKSLQCQRGCSFCCHDIVAATAPEVFRVARHVLEHSGAELAAVLQRLERAHCDTAGRTAADRVGRRRPCAMLVAGACTGYGVRPLVCRAANSGSARACEAAFHDGVTTVPAAVLPFVLRDAHLLSLLAALKATQLDGRAYELNHALWLAVSIPNAEARWLQGEDLFASVQTAPRSNGAGTALIEALLSEALRMGPKDG